MGGSVVNEARSPATSALDDERSPTPPTSSRSGAPNAPISQRQLADEHTDSTRDAPSARPDADFHGNIVGLAHEDVADRLQFHASQCSAGLIHPLSVSEQRFAEAITAGRAPGTVVRYRNKACIVLTVADYVLLHGESWMNDQLLNSFIPVLKSRDSTMRIVAAGGRNDAGRTPQQSTQRFPRSRTLSTYFYTRLCPDRGEYQDETVKNWGRQEGVDLESLDIIFIPVNLRRSHWALVKIDVAHRLLFYSTQLRTAAAMVWSTPPGDGWPIRCSLAWALKPQQSGASHLGPSAETTLFLPRKIAGAVPCFYWRQPTATPMGYLSASPRGMLLPHVVAWRLLSFSIAFSTSMGCRCRLCSLRVFYLVCCRVYSSPRGIARESEKCIGFPTAPGGLCWVL